MTATKVELVERLARAGLRLVEVASFVSPKAVPAMADSAAVVEGTRQLPIHQIGLALNRRGVTDAIASGVAEVRYVIPVTDTFARRNQSTTTSNAVELWNDVAPRVVDAGITSTVVLAVAFGCPFEGTVRPSSVLACLDGLELPPDCIVFADTIGVATPRQVRELLRHSSGAFGGLVRLGAHFHDSRGTALSNVMAAMEEGASLFDASVGGAGGCPFAPGSAGNLATEDLVYFLEGEGSPTDVDLDALVETGRWLETQLKRQLPGRVLRSGGFSALSASGSQERPN